MFIEVAQNLLSIVRGEPHELELSLSSAMFQDCLDDTVAAVCNQDLEAYLELLDHQKPTQRILEVGARRGVLTSYALSVFQSIEARTGGIAFSECIGTSLDDARHRFAEHQQRMNFMCLDFNRDPITQGLQPASYDVILAAEALRRARDISAVLQNLRRVLTPGGQLVLHEITVPGRFEIGFGFGVTADRCGFSGTDVVIRDYQNDAAHCSSIMVSREAAHPSLPHAGTKVLIVVDDDDFQKSLAESIANEKLESGDYVICLADVYRPFLHPMRQATLNIARNWVQQSTNLFWVTAYDAGSTELLSSYPYAEIKDGLLRTLRSEFALNRIISLNVGDSTHDVATCTSYVSSIFESAFITGLSTDVEYIARDGQILTRRLVDDINSNKSLTLSILPETITEPWLPGPPLTLAIQTRGQLETLQFREDLDYYHELGPTDVEIEAKVWGVGFRDVFLALGRLDEDDFGADCAGLVTRVGAKVQSVKVGDRVCMQTTDGMKTYLRAHEWTTAKIPDSVSFEDACAIVIPGMTSLQSLIEIAQMVGAEVFATVGYDHKKQLPIDEYAIPDDHIFYSRDTSFARGVMRTTNGYGVDVILNSLVGESLRASWECIAPYGRMIEIGRAEINANASLPMASFGKNNLFAGVDLHHIVKDMNKKDLAHKLLQKTMDLVRDGCIRPPKPVHIYDEDSVEDAFRYLATGGLGGIGRSILKWMVTRGAKYLLVPSRSGATSAAAAPVRYTRTVCYDSSPDPRVHRRNYGLEERLHVREYDPDTMGADIAIQSRVIMEPSHTASRPRLLYTALFHLGYSRKPGPEQLRGRMHLSGRTGASSQSKGFIQVEDAEFLSLLDVCCDPSYHPEGNQCQMVMGLEDIDTCRVDSLIVVELRSWLSKEFAADVPVFGIVAGRRSKPLGSAYNSADPITPFIAGVKMATKFLDAGFFEQESEGRCTIAVKSRCTVDKIRAYFREGKVPFSPRLGERGTNLLGGEWEKCPADERPWHDYKPTAQLSNDDMAAGEMGWHPGCLCGNRSLEREGMQEI
ncbi:hypothetical protein NHQ30_004804 [Ciborinia camelliae]|nr:hypothetical protein NHQ30_004804 [Ciborinia camelliae]